MYGRHRSIFGFDSTGIAVTVVVVVVQIIQLMVGPADAFLPYDASVLMKHAGRSKHHGNITEEALKITVNWFLMENLDIYPLASHERLKESRPHKEAVKKFRSYVGKSDIMAPYMYDPSYHFTSERFAESNMRLIQEREKVINAIKNQQFDAAWPSAGLLLHALQDFYSYSDWVELGNQAIKEDLGTTSAFDNQLISAPGEKTCHNCQPLGECMRNIRGEILTGNKLTSGYFSQHKVQKPEGKCGHGGFEDNFRNSDATGGINKATVNETYSPHHYLHNQAANLATDATVDMMRRIYQAVIDSRESFGKLLGIERLTSLCFVIDTTGSMSDEIADVKKLTIEMTKEAEGLGMNYVLVPVNDPHPNVIHMTNDSSEMIRLLSELTASGGGDAPEMSMSGMLLAAQNVRFGSKCYVFTDAEAKDRDQMDTLKSVLRLRSVQMDFKLTTVMTRRRRKRSTRVKRDLADDYKEIAEASGGTVTLVKKGELQKALGIIKVESKISSVVVKMGLSVTQTSFEFHVDSTMNETYVEVTSIASSIVSVTFTSPSGASVEADVVTNLRNNKLLKLTEPETGLWTAEVQLPSPGRDIFSYKIFCRTNIDFTYSFISSKGVTVESLPVRGEEYFISIQTHGPVNKDSLDLLFYCPNGTLLSSAKVEHVNSDTVTKSVLPSDDEGFFIALRGTDVKSQPFHRMDTNIVRTSLVTLELALQSNETLDVKPGDWLSVSVSLTNHGVKYDSWGIKVFDTYGYLRSPNTLQMKVETNRSSDFQLAFQVPEGTRPGQVTTVSVMASSATDPNIKNTLVFHVAVIPERSDLQSPTCNVTSITSRACSGTKVEKCSSTRWSAEMAAQDLDSGLTVFKPEKLFALSVFKKSNFTKGSTDVVNASYEADCCDTSITVVAVDGNGNVGRCHLKVDPPMPSAAAGGHDQFWHFISDFFGVISTVIASKFQ